MREKNKKQKKQEGERRMHKRDRDIGMGQDGDFGFVFLQTDLHVDFVFADQSDQPVLSERQHQGFTPLDLYFKLIDGSSRERRRGRRGRGGGRRICTANERYKTTKRER
jgi:hypothetical protein